jgi:hypothetical protein
MRMEEGWRLDSVPEKRSLLEGVKSVVAREWVVEVDEGEREVEREVAEEGVIWMKKEERCMLVLGVRREK